MAISVDAISNGTNDNTQTSSTWSHVVGSGSNRILCVICTARDSSGTNDFVVSSVTFNGSGTGFSMIPGLTDTSDRVRTEIWVLVNPTNTTANIVVTWTGSCQTVAAGAISLNGVDQSSPVHVSDTSQGTGTNPTISLTTSINNTFMVGGVMIDTSSDIINDQGSAIFNLDGSRQAGGSYIALPSSGTGTLSWTSSLSSGAWVAAAIAFKEFSLNTVRNLALLGVG